MEYIDLKTMRLMLQSGANNLYNHHFEVDKLNVFPVPDGDTGTNMNLTMMNGIKELIGHEYDNYKDFATSFSRGLIMGARGNSGVILSQIFRGFFNSFNKNPKQTTISAQEILNAWTNARDFAYKAVMKPVEGTILTVVGQAALRVNETCAEEKNIIVIFEKILSYMEESLKQTPELLPILKKVGVVDSGGAGLVFIVAGMYETLRTKKVININKNIAQTDTTLDYKLPASEEFGYCTETIVKLNKLNSLDFKLNQSRQELEAMDAQSIVMIEDQDLIKTHVHSLKPGQILNYMQQFGDFLTVKIENMTEQAKSHMPTIVKERNLSKNYAIIACVNGKGIDNYLKDELHVDHTILYSNRANPSTNDFLKAIAVVDAKVVFVLPNDGNLLLTAKQAVKLEKYSRVYLIETYNIAQGIAAAIEFYNNVTIADNKSLNKSNFYNKISNFMKAKIREVSYGYLTIADRDTEIDGVKVVKNQYIAGALVKKTTKTKLIVSHHDLLTSINKLLSEIIWNSAELVTIFKGKGVTLEETHQITKILDEDYNVEYEFIEGQQSIYHFLFSVE